MADLPPPNLDLPISREINAYDLRDMTSRHFQPLIRHAVMVLEGQCPLCSGALQVAIRSVANPQDLDPPPDPRLVGRCDVCWLDFIASAQMVEGGRWWELEVSEREPPTPRLEAGDGAA